MRKGEDILVKVLHDCNTSTDDVAETIHRIGIDKGATNPASGLDGLVNLGNKLESFLDTVFADSFRHRRLEGIAMELKDEESFIATNCDGIVLVPINFFGDNIHSSNEAASVPIVKAHKVVTFHSKQGASVKTFDSVIRSNNKVFLLECLEQLDNRIRFTDSIFVRVEGPNEIDSATKRLVTPSKRGINDVFAVSANDDKPTIW